MVKICERGIGEARESGESRESRESGESREARESGESGEFRAATWSQLASTGSAFCGRATAKEGQPLGAGLTGYLQAAQMMIRHEAALLAYQDREG